MRAVVVGVEGGGVLHAARVDALRGEHAFRDLLASEPRSYRNSIDASGNAAPNQLKTTKSETAATSDAGGDEEPVAAQ